MGYKTPLNFLYFPLCSNGALMTMMCILSLEAILSYQKCLAVFLCGCVPWCLSICLSMSALCVRLHACVVACLPINLSSCLPRLLRRLVACMGPVCLSSVTLSVLSIIGHTVGVFISLSFVCHLSFE